MRQMLRLIIIGVLYTLLSPMKGEGGVPVSLGADSAVVIAQNAQQSLPMADVATNIGSEQLISALECNNDMWRTQRSESAVSSSNPLQTKLRYRTNFSSRISLPTNVESRAGHVTHIFDFDLCRSSLRVGYYLYALCRLRI